MPAPTPAQALRALTVLHGGKVELLSIRPAGNAVVARIRRDGREQDLRISTMDAPGLELLADLDRGKVRSALALQYNADGGPPDAA